MRDRGSFRSYWLTLTEQNRLLPHADISQRNVQLDSGTAGPITATREKVYKNTQFSLMWAETQLQERVRLTAIVQYEGIGTGYHLRQP